LQDFLDPKAVKSHEEVEGSPPRDGETPRPRPAALPFPLARPGERGEDRADSGSSTVAINPSRPPQRGHASTPWCTGRLVRAGETAPRRELLQQRERLEE
jgi:hypothetical protein